MKTGSESPGAQFGLCIQTAVELLFKQGVVVTAVKLKYPGIDPLAIVTAKTTEGPKIAFVGGANLDDVGKALLALVRSDAVKWKEDEWEIRRLAGDQEDV